MCVKYILISILTLLSILLLLLLIPWIIFKINYPNREDFIQDIRYTKYNTDLGKNPSNVYYILSFIYNIFITNSTS